MGRLRRFWSLTRREKELLCEATILLFLSNVSVKAVAFRHIERFLSTRWNDAIRDGIDREQEIRVIRRSILRATNVLPWKSLCLSRSIAEFTMLRRRGIPAAMLAGARFSGYSSLEAHAWVETGLVVNPTSSENADFTTVIKIGTESIDR
jgi:hypothetical protein